MNKLWLSLFVLFTIGFALISNAPMARAQEDDDDGPASDDVIISDDDDAGKADADSDQADDDVDAEEAYKTDDEFGGIALADDVEAAVMFPEYERNIPKLKLGDQVNVVIGLSNTGDKLYNVSAVGGHLHAPNDFNYFVHNFTAYRVERVNMRPDEQGSMEYIIRVDPALLPVKYLFSAWVLFNGSDGRQYMRTVYNDTVQVVDESSGSDFRTLLSFALAAAAIGVVGYMFMKSSAKPKRQVERGTRDEPEVEIYKPSPVARAVTRKKSAKKL